MRYSWSYEKRHRQVCWAGFIHHVIVSLDDDEYIRRKLPDDLADFLDKWLIPNIGAIQTHWDGYIDHNSRGEIVHLVHTFREKELADKFGAVLTQLLVEFKLQYDG